MLRKFSVATCLLAASTGCTSKSDVVAEVGDYKITRQDAEYRDEVVRFYFPQDTRKMGLEQLIRTYTYAQIIRNNGHEITDETIRKEEARIDKETLQPQRLEQIKAIFRDDKDAYRRVFVLPTYAERVIYFELFTREPKFHQESLANAEKLKEEARSSGASFETLAKKHGYTHSSFKVSRTVGLIWTLPEETAELPPDVPENMDAVLRGKVVQKQAKQRSSEGEKWINEVIAPLKPGDVSPKIINNQENWQVIRYIRKIDRDTYQMEGITLKKADYNRWLESETPKVVVKQFK